MHDLSPAPSTLLKAAAFIARWSMALMLYAWFLFGAAWVALHLLIVPRIGELRPQLEATVSRVLGMTVRIEAITAYSTGMIPAFELSNVSLLDKRGSEALRLPRILVSLSPQSLLAMKFDQLYIDRPTLNIRRAADGRIYVAGLDLSRGVNADDEILDQLFSQPEFVIRHGAVVWTDEMRAQPPLALRDVDLVLRNKSRRHELRLDATPPLDWGERFGLAARFEQPLLSMDNGRWQEWSGQVYAQFTRVDVSQLKRYADVGFDIEHGRGALRVWTEMRRGRVSAATADVALADVGIRLDPALAALKLETLSGRLAARFSPGTFDFSTEGLAFLSADGLRWPGGNFHLSLADGDAARRAQGEFEADRLDLAALAQIASRLPLGDTIHTALLQYGPRGLVEKVKAKWQGKPDAIVKYEAQGRLQDLHVQAIPARASAKSGAAPAPGSPGIHGATLDFALTESGGKASLTMQDGSFEFPGVFDEPVVPFARFSSELAWQIDGPRVQLQLSNARFSNADADGEMQLKWQTSDPARSSGGSRFPGVLDLQGNLTRAEGNRVYRYLPLVLDASVRDYVRDAVQAGAGSAVKFKVKGDLVEMPFANPKLGEFLISANIRNAVFSYVPRGYEASDGVPWPALTQLSGELVFDRKSLLVKGARGSIAGFPNLQIARADGAIADLLQSPSVVVSLEGRGGLPDMVALVNASPLAALTGNALSHASTTGSGELRLKMTVPLDALDRSTLQGSLSLAGSDVQLAPDTPRLARARGVIGFTESGFTLNALQARVFGGDVRLDGGSIAAAPAGVSATRPAATLALRAQGVASAEGLRQAKELGSVARLAQYASGSAAYTAALTVRSGVPEISLSSNLIGMGLSLPDPVGKSAEVALPLRLETSLVPEALAGAAGARARSQDQLVIALGRIGSATFVRDLSAPEPRVVRGAIAIGLAADESAPLPQDGVIANINMGNVDLDAWSTVLSQVSGTHLSTPEPAAGPLREGAAAAARSYLPTTMAVRARELTLAGRKLRNVVAGGSREGLNWRTNLDADELAGYLEYRQSADTGAGRVFARLSRLTLAPGSASEVEALLIDQPATIPALDIVVDEFELRGKKLGRVEIEAVNRAVAARDGGVREWRLNKFDVIMPEAVFRATGNWAALNAQGPVGVPGSRAAALAEPRRTVMNFRLDIGNAGELLARLGMKNVIRRGKGVMEGQVAWAGSPLTMDYPSLGGTFVINVENGQFLKSDPGLAKLLGVLSLQSLPRRLILDFRDVFTEGFEFDFFRGDVKIDRGIAGTNNLQMKGVNAAVLMEGTADLSRETQDIKVVVVPEINAGTASLIVAAINPAIGLGSFLAQLFLRRPLMEAATQEFHVDGSWIDPRIQRVDRRTGLAGALDQVPAASVEKKAGERQ